MILTMVMVVDVCGQEDLEEGRDEVVDPLDIPTRRVPDGPDVQDAF
jgi:hypothetical protein